MCKNIYKKWVKSNLRPALFISLQIPQIFDILKNHNFHINSFEIESSDVQDQDFIGDFGKKILILALDSDKTAENQTLLQNILKSIDVDFPQDIHLTYLDSNSKVNILNYLNKHNPISVIAFGSTPNQLSLNLNYLKYRVLKINNIQLIFANSFEEISASKPLKKQLWESLKMLKI